VLITNERAIRMICVVGMQKAHLTCGIYPQLSQVIYRRCVTDSPFIVAKVYKKQFHMNETVSVVAVVKLQCPNNAILHMQVLCARFMTSNGRKRKFYLQRG
jgi:hypothetical protein